MMSNNIIRPPLTGPSLHKAGSAAGPRYLPPPLFEAEYYE